ncbi:DUF418 domain-containing protein [Rathayibacter festucae]|uniref:DUF418 domain-containing protein n=1 Tax=Rathayibacter festucae DSM 15932 TaxID=1328866 RepID=A0A3T0T0M2_9MICO|nr:DUF418 domain-containing protein [Rathayibacter festucae]AZZ52257.1 hypothetical protein C1I64_09465 [Rathayibacter festucae DSM 15932]
MTDRKIDSRGEQAERLLTPDLLRGFGTLLVVLTNVPLILTPIRYQLVAGRNPFPGGFTDDLAVAVFLAVPTMTGMGMFVLAMGSGLADLLQGPGGHRCTARRLVVLGMLGLLHGLLVWWGDVLFYYLLAGLVALQFRHRPPRAQLAIGISITLLPLILTVADTFARGGVVRPEITEALSSAASMYESLGDRALSAYTSQDLAAVSGQRLIDWVTYAEDFALIGGVQLAGLFLVGIALARLRREDGLHGQFARAALGLSSAIALGAYAFQLSIQLFLPTDTGLLSALAACCQVAAPPALAVVIYLLLSRNESRLARIRALTWFAVAGRYSLSIYLSTSVLCAGLAYGLALYSRVPFALSMVIALVIHGTLVLACQVLARRGLSGPVERMYRVLAPSAPRPRRSDRELTAGRNPSTDHER